jgi:hypothetical protein
LPAFNGLSATSKHEIATLIVAVDKHARRLDRIDLLHQLNTPALD